MVLHRLLQNGRASLLAVTCFLQIGQAAGFSEVEEEEEEEEEGEVGELELVWCVMTSLS